MHFLEIGLLAFTGIQDIYLMLYLYAFLKERPSSNAESVGVSVIVCAHDEEKNIKELVPLLLEQAYDEFEVIVVEDRSNDESYDYLYEISKLHKRLRLVAVKDKPEHINGKKFALTLGIKAAKYDWVLLTDADCRPIHNRWIEMMSKQFGANASIVLGYSPYQNKGGLLNSFIRFESLVTAIQYMGMALLGKPYMGVGRNLAYRKDIFLKNKGFNTHLSVTGGDDDLFINEVSNQSNTVVCLGKDSIVYSKPKTSWNEFYFQKIRHLSVGKRYRLSNKMHLGLFNLSWIACWLLVVPAVVYSSTIYIPIGAFVFRSILIIILAYVSSRKLGDTFKVWKVAFLDFIFAIYYLVTGLVALSTSKVRWKRN